MSSGVGSAPSLLCATASIDPSTDCAAAAVRPDPINPRTKSRRDTAFERYLATSSLMAASSRRRGPTHAREVIRHRVDLGLGPQRSTTDHSVQHPLPGPAVLAEVVPHGLGVTLEALAHQQILTGDIRQG